MGLKQEIQLAREKGIPTMMDSGMHFLLEYLQNHPEIMRILEVGTAIGYSAIQMAQVRENITIDTIEVEKERYEEALRNIKEYALEDRIFVHHMDAMLYKTAQYYDFFFIDAAKSQYQKYVEHFLPTSYVGSIFFFDNLSFHGMVENIGLTENRSTIQMMRKIKKFTEWLQTNPQFETQFYPEIGDGIAIAKRIK